MPPIKESTQQTAGASAPLDLCTQRYVVDPKLVQVNATACISKAAATNAARCRWETDMEKRTSATEQRTSATEQRTRATEKRTSAIEQHISATKYLGPQMRRELGEIRELLQAAIPELRKTHEMNFWPIG